LAELAEHNRIFCLCGGFYNAQDGVVCNKEYKNYPRKIINLVTQNISPFIYKR